MNYLELPQFIEKVSIGELGPGLPIEVYNMGGDKIHKISFLDHCDELCKKHETNRLRLLSVIQQKLNGDMIVRLSNAPVFRDKISSVLNEWGVNEIEPIDLFKCPDNCYDTDNISSLTERIQTHDNELNQLDENIENMDSGLFNMVEGLRNNYHACGEDLQRNLIELEERQDEYEPVHRSILCDLSTRHKPFYLNNLIDSEQQQKMVHHVNKRVTRHIPDNIHTIFLNNVLIPTLIKKEMEKHKFKCMKLKEDINQKQDKLNEIMEKIGPDEPFSVGIMKLLTDLGNVFKLDSEGELSDDYSDSESDNEEKLENIMKNLVHSKEESTNKKIKIKEEDEPEEMFHLRLNKTHKKKDKDEDLDEDLDEGNSINEFIDIKTTDFHDKVIINRNVKRNNCNCDICIQCRVCLTNYKNYEIHGDKLSQIFKDAIDNACSIHNISI